MKNYEVELENIKSEILKLLEENKELKAENELFRIAYNKYVKLYLREIDKKESFAGVSSNGH